MSHWATFKQTATNLWVTLRHDILALAVFLNGLLIFKTIYGMSVNLLDIFHIKAFSELDLSLLANAPLFMLGVFLVLNSIGLLFCAKTSPTVAPQPGQFLHLLVSRHYCFTQPTVRFI